jgi:hypothetical protein
MPKNLKMLTVKNHTLNFFIKYFPLVAILFSTISYFFMVIEHTVNIPMEDDYTDVIPFILQYSSNTGFSKSIDLIFSQHNDHIIATNRVIYALLYELTGEVNFYILTLIGNLNILALVYLYSRQISNNLTKLTLIAVVSSLLFQIACLRDALWAMTVIANYSVITLSFLTLICLNSRRKIGFPLAVLLGFSACITFASGQIVLLVGLILLVNRSLEHRTPLLNYKTIAWLVFSVLIIMALQSHMADKRFDQYLSLNSVLTNMHNYIDAFFKLIGSPFAYGNHLASFVIGIIGLSTLLILIYFGAWKQHVIFNFSVFLLLSLGTIALTRSWVGDEYLIVSAARYKFIAYNYWACIFLLIVRSFPKHETSISRFSMVITLFLCIVTFNQQAHIVKDFQQKKIKGFEYWLQTGNSDNLLWPFDYSRKKFEDDLQQIIIEGKYTPRAL